MNSLFFYKSEKSRKKTVKKDPFLNIFLDNLKLGLYNKTVKAIRIWPLNAAVYSAFWREGNR